MASAAEIEKECCVCSLVYVNPKLFPCHHSLCEACVNRLQKNKKIVCPTCRAISDISRLVHDFRLEKFLEAFKEQEDEFARIISEVVGTDSTPVGTNKCELCEKNDISFYCINCQQWICSDCEKIHHRIKNTKHHRIEKLSDKISEMSSTMVPTLAPLANKTWNYQKHVSLRYRPRSLRLIKQQLWQCHQEGITIYSLELEEKRRIPCGDMGNVFDVAMTPDDTCVVAAEKGLFNIKANGEKLAEIDDGLFTSIACHDNHVYAAENSSRTIRVYDNNGTWEQRTDDSIQCEDDNIRIVVSSRFIMASFRDVHRIDAFSYDGELQFTLGPGVLNLPWLCCNDCNDMVLIADSQNSLHIVNLDKKWKVVRLDKEIKLPCSSCYNEGRLYVASFIDKTLSMFE